MKEFNFIELLKPLSPPSPGGIGDDAAVIGDYLISTDIMAEGIHFTAQQPLEEIITHLLVSNISDIAAMGSKNGNYKALLGIAAPAGYDKTAILRTLAKLTASYRVSLIGGDTVTSKNGLFLSLTIIGAKGGRVLTRSGARKGDLIYVSRPLGASQYALHRRTGVLPDCPDIDYTFTPEPELGELLGDMEGVTSCIDISDGLGIDMSHIATESGVKAIINADLIPLADLCLNDIKKLEYALSSGEEYCLAFTVAPDKAAELEKTVQDRLKRQLYRIGIIEEGIGCLLRKADGSTDDISIYGYEHD